MSSDLPLRKVTLNLYEDDVEEAKAMFSRLGWSVVLRTVFHNFIKERKRTNHELVKEADENLGQFSNTPMLIFWGERDFVLDTEYLNEWKRRFQKAEVHCFSDAGHYVLEDVPAKIVSLMHDFLKRHPLKDFS